MIDREIADLHVALPAKIVKYNAEEMRADIQLLAKQELGEEEVEMPLILEVPVSHFKAGSFIIRPAYSKGDVVQVLFNERAIDNLLVSNRPESVEFKRKHSFDDATIIGGLKTERESDYPSANQEDFLIYNTETEEKITIKKAGGIELGESTFKKIVTETFKELFNAHTHSSPAGGSTGPPATLMTDTHLSSIVEVE